MMPVDRALLDAMSALWRIPAPGPDNLLQHPAFVALADLCCDRHGGAAKLSFSLYNALHALGLPCHLRGHLERALDVEEAATRLDVALSRTTSVRRYFCPLDLADDLPTLRFGPCQLNRFDANTLGLLFDADRLRRLYPAIPIDLSRLAQFHWLIVDETVALDPRPEARASPIFFTHFGRDLGEFDPLIGRYPPAVESALFFLLLAPWEDWSTMLEVDWRGFRVPWIYMMSDDLCVRPARPPDPDALSWEPWFVQDEWGEEIELERPLEYRLDDAAASGIALFTQKAWEEVEAARATPLFETPIVHFFVQAFLGDGIDEIMAHMTALEAALGLESDHKAGLRPKPDLHAKLRSTGRMATRIAAATSDPQAASAYGTLFDVRSAFVHGRAGVSTISTEQRVTARRLARQVVGALVDRARVQPGSRDALLGALLDEGAALLAAGKAVR
jgi:hypothetical protein